MALVANHTFLAGETLTAAQLNGMHQVIDALSGIKVDEEYLLTHNDAANPTLVLEHSGTGKPLQLKIDGTTYAEMNTAGQWRLLVADGTAPMIVTSTTRVANLNADMVDGVEGADLLATTASDQEIDGDGAANVDFKVTGTNRASVELKSSTGGYQWRLSTPNADVIRFDRWNGSAWETKFQLNASGEVSNWAVKSAVSIGAFYEGEISTGAKQPRYIANSNAGTISFDEITAVYTGGSPSGDTTIQARLRSATDGGGSSVSITIPSSHSAGHTLESAISLDVTNIQQVEWTVTAAGGHQGVSVYLHGTQEVV